MKCSSYSGNLYSFLSKFLSPKSWGYGFYPHRWCHCDLGEVIHKNIVQPFWAISLSQSTFFSGNIRSERNKLYCFCLLLIWTWGWSSNCSTSFPAHLFQWSTCLRRKLGAPRMVVVSYQGHAQGTVITHNNCTGAGVSPALSSNQRFVYFCLTTGVSTLGMPT